MCVRVRCAAYKALFPRVSSDLRRKNRFVRKGLGVCLALGGNRGRQDALQRLFGRGFAL